VSVVSRGLGPVASTKLASIEIVSGGLFNSDSWRRFIARSAKGSARERGDETRTKTDYSCLAFIGTSASSSAHQRGRVITGSRRRRGGERQAAERLDW